MHNLVEVAEASVVHAGLINDREWTSNRLSFAFPPPLCVSSPRVGPYFASLRPRAVGIVAPSPRAGATGPSDRGSYGSGFNIVFG